MYFDLISILVLNFKFAGPKNSFKCKDTSPLTSSTLLYLGVLLYWSKYIWYIKSCIFNWNVTLYVATEQNFTEGEPLENPIRIPNWRRLKVNETSFPKFLVPISTSSRLISILFSQFISSC